MNPVPFSTKQSIIAYLAAEGQTVPEIAAAVELGEEKVANILLDQAFVLRVKELRQKLYSKDAKKAFDDLLPNAQDLIKKIIENPNTKPHLQFQVAQEVFDRSMGKAKQTVEHEGSLLRAVFEKMDQKRDNSVIDVTRIIEPELPALANPNARDADFNENPNTRDAVDDWMEKNL